MDPRLGTDVYLFALLLSLAAGLIFGVVPSLGTSRSALIDNIKEEAGVTGLGGHGAKFQKTLLAGPVAFSRADVLWLVLRQGMVLAGIGAITGLVLSLLLGRVFSRMLYGLSPADPLSLAAAAAVLITVTILACWLPARAADPMIALRQN